MTIHATAKAKIYIGSPDATISELVDFEADTYTQIKEVEDFGEWGPEAKELTFTSVEDTYRRRRKGSIDNGVVNIVTARDPNDPGQIKARAGVEESLPYRTRGPDTWDDVAR